MPHRQLTDAGPAEWVTTRDVTLSSGTLINGGPAFAVVLSPDVRALAPMRHEVAERLEAHDFAPMAIDDLLIVLSELCTNAIEATAPGDGPVLVRVLVGVAALTLEVENVGLSFDHDAAAAQRRADTDTERGRGLLIVRALADDVTVRHHDGRCIVRVVMPPG